MGNQSYKWVGTRQPRPDGADKVTGRARFGADFDMPGQLVGKVLRSPHAHANIRSIDTSKAKALRGVKAVITAADLPDMPDEMAPAGEVMVNLRDVTRNVMAREKALYDGHAVAAVAATSEAIAREALDLIEVDYEVLPHVIDVDGAVAADAPILHDHLRTDGDENAADTPTNVAKRIEFLKGDLDAGWAEAEVVVEGSFTTKPVHQGYIEPHAAVASATEDGQVQLWCSTQGQFNVRGYCAKLLDMQTSQIRVTPSEIGGGFGGKTVVYLEPLAIKLSQMAGKPVKLVMSREEVFRGSGPTSAGSMDVKLGATKDGRIVAADFTVRMQAGAFPGSPVGPACMCSFACYDIANVKVVGFDVVSNRPKVAAYRAPGSPVAAWGIESAINMLAEELGMDQIDLRLKNAAREGTKTHYGPTFKDIGMIATLEAAKNSPHYQTPLKASQGRGVAVGFWFNIGMDSSAACHIGEDGTVTLISGSPDIGGSRASLALMAAEELGIDYHKIRPIVADTASIGFNFLTGGSRVTFATGMAVVQAVRDAIDEMRARAAKLWEVDVEAVIWEDGCAKPAGSNVGDFDPMTLAEIAASAGKTGGPINGHAQLNAQGAGPGFGAQIYDVSVDADTGHTTVERCTVVQDVGTAIHPDYVEGQLQGGVVQGIGWALNEEYIYNDKGQLENTGFLDYRMPVASDLPMIEPIIVEVPNPSHPYGVRGVGEVPIVPPMAAIGNAIAEATGVRMTDLPMSPPKLSAALDAAKVRDAADD
ncbi:MAG: xanthine dehydrogenase family protein molybdopterin-binding subunit [Pseudomonadota bacterium]|jgi:CO/xanthine dehydrogenase Mo-binding subunit|nr:oxidoreductase [Nisaea sp.]MEC8006501.1 xanthine dehydrogenase family protein molybdopterin-binding subunit [Pseudomonadota bacterium]MEC8028517.1 xanthine dehydrogenase family protein molybdopterin-binding subunit [Pseudomonadota bacterium]MEC8053015.1 xanthine dehydrogenase family protein molybdopterin-binding subunit [Pseudomonadota bacterium]MEC8060844.1 xanthine dehydrogenase family protein molybdopterin-binding subunit [Pseudomonadota bacterium]